jgi:hypothetical protein
MGPDVHGAELYIPKEGRVQFKNLIVVLYRHMSIHFFLTSTFLNSGITLLREMGIGRPANDFRVLGKPWSVDDFVQGFERFFSFSSPPYGV